MVSGFTTSPLLRSRIASGEESEMVILEKLLFNLVSFLLKAILFFVLLSVKMLFSNLLIFPTSPFRDNSSSLRENFSGLREHFSSFRENSSGLREDS